MIFLSAISNSLFYPTGIINSMKARHFEFPVFICSVWFHPGRLSKLLLGLGVYQKCIMKKKKALKQGSF
jgi:hypothetical protein